MSSLVEYRRKAQEKLIYERIAIAREARKEHAIREWNEIPLDVNLCAGCTTPAACRKGVCRKEMS
jgi:hypothetical protein